MAFVARWWGCLYIVVEVSDIKMENAIGGLDQQKMMGEMVEEGDGGKGGVGVGAGGGHHLVQEGIVGDKGQVGGNGSNELRDWEVLAYAEVAQLLRCQPELRAGVAVDGMKRLNPEANNVFKSA